MHSYKKTFFPLFINEKNFLIDSVDNFFKGFNHADDYIEDSSQKNPLFLQEVAEDVIINIETINKLEKLSLNHSNNGWDIFFDSFGLKEEYKEFIKKKCNQYKYVYHCYQHTSLLKKN